MFRNGGKCLHLNVWGGKILCKWQCYTGNRTFNEYIWCMFSSFNCSRYHLHSQCRPLTWIGVSSVHDVVQHFSINLQGICECRTYIADFPFTFLSRSFTLATVGSTSGGVGSNLGSGGLSALCYQQHTCASNWQLWKHSVVFSDWNCVFFWQQMYANKTKLICIICQC